MRRKALLTFAIYAVVTSIILSPKIPNANASSDAYLYVWVKSGSMKPTFEIDDLLTVKTDVSASQIYAASSPDGDVILFSSPRLTGELIVHRAIAKIENNGTQYFQTKGDANIMPDYWSGPDTLNGMISEKLLIGKVMAFSRTFYAGTWDGIAYYVTVYTNSTISNFNFNQSFAQVEFDITGYVSQADNGFCNVTIPKNLLYCELYSWQVRLNDTSIAYSPTQNETHTSIYFSHGYSMQNVEIIGTNAIPEFPSIMILPLFMVFTVVIAAFTSERNRHRS